MVEEMSKTSEGQDKRQREQEVPESAKSARGDPQPEASRFGIATVAMR